MLGISKPPKQDNFEFFGGYERFMKRLNEIYENIITYSPSSFSRKQTPWGYEKSKLYFVPRGEPKNVSAHGLVELWNKNRNIMNSLELIMTTEPNFIPVVRKYHPQNNHSKNEPIDSTEKLNPDYTEIVSNNADNAIDVREVIIITINLVLLNQNAVNMIKKWRKNLHQRRSTWDKK